MASITTLAVVAWADIIPPHNSGNAIEGPVITKKLHSDDKKGQPDHGSVRCWQAGQLIVSLSVDEYVKRQQQDLVEVAFSDRNGAEQIILGFGETTCTYIGKPRR